MQDLLPNFERELGFLRTHAGEFARRYPKIAGQLLLTGEAGEDPHVERLIQSFALLSSRIHKRLDDDFPLFTESFLEVLYPHYLRPFPSCSIACFEVKEISKLTVQAQRIERGTSLLSRPVASVPCRFETAYDVDLLPVRISSASFRGTVAAPDGTVLPKGATTAFSLQLELNSPLASWSKLGVSALRVYLDGDPSQVSVAREMLCHQVLATMVQTSPVGPWSRDDTKPLAVGFADDEALIDFDARSHAAYRLLTEYFAFPEKFDFVDLPLPQALMVSNAPRVTLHYLMAGLRADSHEAQVLETVDARNLVLGCTPVVNLFRRKADPIRVTHTSLSYPVLPEGQHAFAYEVHSVDKVYRKRQSPDGDSIDEFRPFYSLQHEHLLVEGESAGRYWALHRDDTLARGSPGYEAELSIVDIDFDPMAPHIDTLSIDVTATNRNLPQRLSINNPGGDLFLEGSSLAREIRLLRKPTPTHRFETGRGAHWRLISHLSLNHLSLSAGGVEALKELLRLYDLPQRASTRRQLEGVVAIDFRPAHACMPGNPFAVFVRGIEIRLEVDEPHFVGSGLRLFAQVLDHFFGLYVHVNSFIQLKLFSSRTQEELFSCPRRSGSSPLV